MKGNKKIIVRVCVVCVVVLALLFLKLLSAFVLNEIFISKYEKNQTDNGIIGINTLVNFPESYIVHYNLGIGYYADKQFSKAVDEYNEALKTVPDERVCDVRLNLGLAMVKKIDVSSDKIKDELREVAESLLEDSCAKKSGDGRHKEAQKLYDEIMKALKENTENNGGTQGEDTEEEPPENEEEEELEQKLREQAEEAANDRNDGYHTVEKYEYYDGKTW